MALSFNESKGGAQKSNLNMYTFQDGENRIRIVGDILPRYVYWLKGENNKNIPVECLSFDRDEERFANMETDWVAEYFPEQRCSWAYVTQGIVNGELKVINLKKKLWESVIETAEDLGDPTDIENGWDLVFTRKKTGSQNFNVEYTLQPLRCKKQVRPLTEEERELIKDLKSMDELMPRPTPAEQKKFLDRIMSGGNDKEVDEEALDEEFDPTVG